MSELCLLGLRQTLGTLCDLDRAGGADRKYSDIGRRGQRLDAGYRL